jgi:hypothetical protein
MFSSTLENYLTLLRNELSTFVIRWRRQKYFAEVGKLHYIITRSRTTSTHCNRQFLAFVLTIGSNFSSLVCDTLRFIRACGTILWMKWNSRSEPSTCQIHWNKRSIIVTVYYGIPRVDCNHVYWKYKHNDHGWSANQYYVIVCSWQQNKSATVCGRSNQDTAQYSLSWGTRRPYVVSRLLKYQVCQSIFV